MPPVLALGVTETWLTDYVSDAQVALQGYQCIRSDRSARRGGRCALLLHQKVDPSDETVFNDSRNNLVAVFSESLQAIFAVVYRSPSSPDSGFFFFFFFLFFLKSIIN